MAPKTHLYHQPLLHVQIGGAKATMFNPTCLLSLPLLPLPLLLALSSPGPAKNEKLQNKNEALVDQTSQRLRKFPGSEKLYTQQEQLLTLLTQQPTTQLTKQPTTQLTKQPTTQLTQQPTTQLHIPTTQLHMATMEYHGVTMEWRLALQERTHQYPAIPSSTNNAFMDSGW